AGEGRGRAPALAQQLQAEDGGEHGLEDDRAIVVATAVAHAAVVAVLVAALEALAEVVGVVRAAHVAARIAEAGIEPCERLAEAAGPAVETVGAAGAQALRIAVL